MKILCPVCGVEGFVQVRGRNVMIQHYQGFSGGKRSYLYHKVLYEEYERLQVNASKRMQVNQPKTSGILAEEWSLRRDLDPRPLPYQGNAPPG